MAGYQPSLEPEFICDFADWTPAEAEVTGSTQGFAMHGRYAFVLHDKGHICIFDMKKKRLVNHFQLEGNTSHCNNACFGAEKASRKSKFPLLYIASCGILEVWLMLRAYSDLTEYHTGSLQLQESLEAV